MFQGFLPSSIFPILDVLSDRGQTPGVHAQHSELQGRNFKTNLGMFMFNKVFSHLPDLTAVLPSTAFLKKPSCLVEILEIQAGTVAILAQGTNWAAADTQAIWQR